jgi:hypothetical protein
MAATAAERFTRKIAILRLGECLGPGGGREPTQGTTVTDADLFVSWTLSLTSMTKRLLALISFQAAAVPAYVLDPVKAWSYERVGLSLS